MNAKPARGGLPGRGRFLEAILCERDYPSTSTQQPMHRDANECKTCSRGVRPVADGSSNRFLCGRDYPSASTQQPMHRDADECKTCSRRVGLVADGDGKCSLCELSKSHCMLRLGYCNDARLANDRTAIATVRFIPVGSWGRLMRVRTGIPHPVVPHGSRVRYGKEEALRERGDVSPSHGFVKTGRQSRGIPYSPSLLTIARSTQG
jgi:hypothetical protein